MGSLGNGRAWVLVGVLVLLAGVAGYGLASVPAAAGSTVNTTAQPSGISVAGEGKLTLTPDVAEVRLGVEARARSAEEARNRAAEAMQAVVAGLRENGVLEKDIKTAFLNVGQDRRFVNGQEVIEGYRVTNMVSAKVRQLENVEKVIDGAVAAAGNLVRVDGVTFTVDNPARLQAQLRELAVADARSRAEQIARLSGVGLGKLVWVQESGGAAPPPRSPLFRGAPAAEAASVPTFVSPGETEVRLNIEAVYSILP